MKIFKWELQITDVQEIKMPMRTKILSLQTQSDFPTMWGLCDPEAQLVTRTFAMYGTGHELPQNIGKYIGTFQIMNGGFVYHVFEL